MLSVIPVSVYVLALAVFAQGTSEFMLAGLLPGIAADLHVSLSAAGQLTSAFAAGMVVGAPLAAVFGRRLRPRQALSLFLIVFIAVHLIGAVTGSFGVLLATRVVGALCTAGFLAVALTVTTAAVPPAAHGRALSVLLGGTTLACVIGVPAGALIGSAFGWRDAFWVVAGLALPAVAAIRAAVRGDRRPAAAPVRREFAALRRPQLTLTLLLGALVNGATFCSFTYLAPLVTEVAGLRPASIPLVLALFGVGSFLGVAAGGRLADRRATRWQAAAAVALLIGWIAFAGTAGSPTWTMIWAVVQGTLSFAVGSSLIARALRFAGDAPTLAGAFATSSLNVGAAAGPWLGGAALAAGLGYRSPLTVSAVLVGLAVLIGGTGLLLQRSNRVRGDRTIVAE